MKHLRPHLERVPDQRAPQEDLIRHELARAISAVAAQQERAVAAERAVERTLLALRQAMTGAGGLGSLRAGREDLASSRSRAADERAGVEALAVLADRRRAELVRDGEGAGLDELAIRRAARRRGVAA